MKPRDYLSYYATQFDTVEVDSTFYRTPSVSTVTGWYEKTPADFVLAAKVPQIITHEKVLVGCESEFEEFVDRMDLLDEKLGPMLLQFPYFNKYTFGTGAEFLERLRFFLRKIKDLFTCRFAIEIRNKSWLDERFLDALREHNVALALTDTSFMPRPWEMKGPRARLCRGRAEFIPARAPCVKWSSDERTKRGRASLCREAAATPVPAHP